MCESRVFLVKTGIQIYSENVLTVGRIARHFRVTILHKNIAQVKLKSSKITLKVLFLK